MYDLLRMRVALLFCLAVSLPRQYASRIDNLVAEKNSEAEHKKLCISHGGFIHPEMRNLCESNECLDCNNANHEPSLCSHSCGLASWSSVSKRAEKVPPCGSREGVLPHAPCTLMPSQCLETREFEWISGGHFTAGDSLRVAPSTSSKTTRRPVISVAVYRLIGNDMVPLQRAGQLRTNTAFAAAFEAEAPCAPPLPPSSFPLNRSHDESQSGPALTRQPPTTTTRRRAGVFSQWFQGKGTRPPSVHPPPPISRAARSRGAATAAVDDDVDSGVSGGGGGRAQEAWPLLDVAMVWVLNRIVNASEEAAIVDSIEAANSAKKEQRQCLVERQRVVDFVERSEGERGQRDGRPDHPPPNVARLKLIPGCVGCLPDRQRVPYVMGLNQARNTMIEDARRRSFDWVLPLDGNQFLTVEFWRSLTKALHGAEQEERAAVLLPMLRLRTLPEQQQQQQQLGFHPSLLPGPADAAADADAAAALASPRALTADSAIETVSAHLAQENSGESPPTPSSASSSSSSSSASSPPRHRLKGQEDVLPRDQVVTTTHILSEPQVALRLHHRHDPTTMKALPPQGEHAALAGSTSAGAGAGATGGGGASGGAFPLSPFEFFFDEARGYGAKSKVELLERLCRTPPVPHPPTRDRQNHRRQQQQPAPPQPASSTAAVTTPSISHERNSNSSVAGFRPLCCDRLNVGLTAERGFSTLQFRSIAASCPITIRLFSFPPSGMGARDRKTGKVTALGTMSQTYVGVRHWLRGKAVAKITKDIARWLDETSNSSSSGGASRRCRP